MTSWLNTAAVLRFRARDGKAGVGPYHQRPNEGVGKGVPSVGVGDVRDPTVVPEAAFSATVLALSAMSVGASLPLVMMIVNACSKLQTAASVARRRTLYEFLVLKLNTAPETSLPALMLKLALSVSPVPATNCR